MYYLICNILLEIIKLNRNIIIISKKDSIKKYKLLKTFVTFFY